MLSAALDSTCFTKLLKTDFHVVQDTVWAYTLDVEKE